MSLLDFFRPTGRRANACVAKERLQIIVAHQRGGKHPDYLPMLQKELLDVISKYVKIDKEQVKVALERDNEFSVLELNIILPEERAVETV
ncbi:MAG: cell division topological specificity factor MinE [Gammaproteobacteria bacterium]|jgi:cell division topological specificity factor